MKHRLQAVVAVSLLVAGVAYADQSYLLDLNGGGIHFFDAFECPLPTQVCNPPQAPFTWTGVITAVVDGDAAGTFSGSHFVSLSFMPTSGPVLAFRAGDLPGGSVTVLDGAVTSLNAQPTIGGTAVFTFSGLSVQYNQPATHHVGPYFGGGVLTPVPEPHLAALMLAGLAAVAAVTRRRKRAG